MNARSRSHVWSNQNYIVIEIENYNRKIFFAKNYDWKK